jgi:predicted metal-dependent hydrolase
MRRIATGFAAGGDRTIQPRRVFRPTFHHLRRANYHGTVYMLRRGAQYLTPFAPRCRGVDVEALLVDAAAALNDVERLGPARLAEFDWRLAPIVRVDVG